MVQVRTRKRPSAEVEEDLRANGLLFSTTDADNTPLSFSPDWSSQAIDRWFREIAPKPFEYLGLMHGPRNGKQKEYHWRLLRRDPKAVFLYGNEDMSGNDLDVVKGGAGRNKMTCRIMIGMYSFFIHLQGIS